MEKHAYNHALLNRAKANLFFFMGSVLYIPVSIWAVRAENQGLGSPDDHLTYVAILVAATLSYLSNGILETWLAYKAYQKVKASPDTTDSPPIGAIVNGLLFSLAATLELSYSLIGRQIALLNMSALCYIANAVFTLYLRRHDDMASRPARMIRAGDILFLLGACLDFTSTYMERNNMLDQYGAFWLSSSLAWFINSILYLVADKISVDEELEVAEPIISEAEMPGQEAGKLSNIV